MGLFCLQKRLKVYEVKGYKIVFLLDSIIVITNMLTVICVQVSCVANFQIKKIYF